MRAVAWIGVCGVAGAVAAIVAWRWESAAGIAFAMVLAIGQTAILRRILPTLRWTDLLFVTGLVGLAADSIVEAGRGLTHGGTAEEAIIGVAVVGGALGLLLGGAQWMVLRHHGRGARMWVGMMGVGGCLGALAFVELLDPDAVEAGAWLVAGLVGGLVFGLPGASAMPGLTRWVDPARLKGRTVVVTGGNRGIGRAIAEAALSSGARVILLSRRPAEGWWVVRRVGGEGRVFACDLRNPESVARAAREVVGQIGRVDVLVHAAGTVPSSLQRNAQGIEETLAVHAVGPILLTEALRPSLAASTAPRVVFITGANHRRGRIDPEDLGWARRTWGRFAVKAAAQAARIHATRSLAERLAEDGVTVVAVHPGAVRTGACIYGPWWFRLLLVTVFRPLFVRAELGALPVLAAMIDDDVPNGGWRRRFTAEPVSVPADIGERLVQRSLEREVGEPTVLRAT